MRFASAVLVIATSAITEKSWGGNASGLSVSTKPSGADSSPASLPGSTIIVAVNVTKRYTTPTSAIPPKSARGKVRLGLSVSTTTLTESSKPIRA